MSYHFALIFTIYLTGNLYFSISTDIQKIMSSPFPLLFTNSHHSIKEKEQRLVGLESGWCIWVVHMSIRGLLFQWASTMKFKLIMLVYCTKRTSLSSHIDLFSPWYSWKIAELALNNNHSPTQSLTLSPTR